MAYDASCSGNKLLPHPGWINMMTAMVEEERKL